MSNLFYSSLDRSSQPQSDTQLYSWLRLVRDRRWGTIQKQQLLAALDGPDAIYAASAAALKSIVTERTVRGDSKRCAASDQQIEADLNWLSQPDHSFISFNDPCYPALLKQISDPPIALFAKGNLALIDEPKVAIVGSRRPTPVGAKVVQEITNDLAQLGLVITSGMALGVDGLAHNAALQAGAPTIAVMGCGLDLIYPRRHSKMFEQIAEQGLLLSEYPLAYPANRYTFPQRNRIVSGLSYGVVIAEAAARSGTLITARLAAEQDREVMVIPGSSLSSQYEGSHLLIQQGAALVLNGLDVVRNLAGVLAEELLVAQAKQQNIDSEDGGSLNAETDDQANNTITSPERQLLKHIAVESTSIDTIISNSGLTAAEVSSMLLILELDNRIAISDDGGYVNISRS